MPTRLMMSLDVESCDALADYYSDLAELFRRHARYLQDRSTLPDDYERLKSDLATLPAQYDAFRKAGLDHDNAVMATADQTLAPCETIELYLQKRDKERFEKRRTDRDREIMRLARRGLTAKDIATKISNAPKFGGISAGHVARIIRQTLRDTDEQPEEIPALTHKRTARDLTK